LVPGGVTNTGMVPLEAGYDRAEMIQPAVMAPPRNWLLSDAAGGVTGQNRYCRARSQHVENALEEKFNSIATPDMFSARQGLLRGGR
jgi:hypothetical protein